MNKVLLDLGFIEIRWYSFFILMAILTASFIIWKEAKKKNLEEETFIDLVFYGLIVGILGARLYYVVFSWDSYKDDLLSILNLRQGGLAIYGGIIGGALAIIAYTKYKKYSIPLALLQIWNGGLAIHGGIIAGLIVIIFYTKKKKINLKLLLDMLVPGLIIGQAVGRWGNFFNQEAFGRIVKLSTLENMHIPKFIIDGMYINGEYREPTFFYESLLCLIGFIILILVRKTKKNKTSQLSAIYLIWYGIIRLIIESLRSDSLMLGPIKVAQLVSILFIVVGVILLIRSKNNQNYIDDNIYESSRRKLCTKK